MEFMFWNGKYEFYNNKFNEFEMRKNQSHNKEAYRLWQCQYTDRYVRSDPQSDRIYHVGSRENPV